jgi:hypothetical protein
MADDQPAAGEPAPVECQVPHLALHLEDVMPGDLEVLALAEISPGVLAGGELEVGHVDVDDAVHQRQAVGAVVRARVVDDRQPQPTLDRQRQRLEDLWHDVLGRDPVDVVAADLLQLEHHRREPRGRCLPPLDLPGDLEVLAEHAAQVAA